MSRTIPRWNPHASPEPGPGRPSSGPGRRVYSVTRREGGDGFIWPCVLDGSGKVVFWAETDSEARAFRRAVMRDRRDKNE